MDELIKFIRQYEPLAKAIVGAAAQADKLGALDVKIKELEAKHHEMSDAFASAQASAGKAKDYVEKANAEVIQARDSVSQMVAGAKVEAQRILDRARVEAETAARNITDDHRFQHEALQRKIATAKSGLASLQDKIAARQADHDTVMSSLASLKARLGAA